MDLLHLNNMKVLLTLKNIELLLVFLFHVYIDYFHIVHNQANNLKKSF